MSRILLISLAASTSFLAASPQPKPFRQPLVFEPNRGQAQPQINWIARGPGYQLLFTNEGMTMFFEKSTAQAGLRMTLEGGRPWSHVTGLESTGGVSNYLGETRSKPGLNNVPHYSRISIAGVYPGVDLNFYNNQDHLEYDFVVHPGADPKQIQLAFAGQKEMRLDSDSGDLVVTTINGGELHQAHPTVYQQLDRRVDVVSGYKILDGSRVAFQLGAYHPQSPLIIDPVVSFSTFLEYAQAYAIAVDKQGNSYITGSASEGFRVTDHSAFKDCHDNGFGCTRIPPDIFVTKLSSSGNVLFSSFQGNGVGAGIAVDSTGIYVAASDDDKHPPLALKLDLYGNPIYRQVLALPNYQNAWGIAVDSQHNAWVTGETFSSSHGSDYRDVWLVKLNPQGSVLSSQTIGGGGVDEANGIAVDSADNPWVTGETCSGDFPATPGLNDLRDQCGIFVMALTNQSPASIRFASVFAGSSAVVPGVDGDAGTAIAVNAYGEAYITGHTTGFFFPVVPGAYQSYNSSPGLQAFVCKLDNNGHLVYSTLLGGNGDGDTYGQAIALNAAGEVYIAGNTSSTNFPGNGPMRPGGFISKFSPDLSALIYSRQTGDSAWGIATLESLPAVTPAQMYVTGLQYFNGEEHAFVDRFTDDQQFNHLRNYWIGNQFINIQSGSPAATTIGPDWWSADWYFDAPPQGVRATPNAFWIRNRWTNQYLNLANGTVLNVTTQPASLFSQWIFEPVGNNVYRIRNGYREDWALNNQSGTLTAGPVQPDWWSAWWIVER